MTTRPQHLPERAADQAGAQHQHPQWLVLLRRALVSGSVASVCSTLAVSAFSRWHSGTAAAGTNAASQWFWYPQARMARQPSLRHTLVGYAVHHASSVFWACTFEALRPRTARAGGRAARAAGVAAAAYVVDYHVVPRRLSPGFEHRIGASGMWATYAAFALGLFVASHPAVQPRPRMSHRPAPPSSSRAPRPR